MLPTKPLTALAGLAAAILAGGAPAVAGTAKIPTAEQFDGLRVVGALFYGPSDSAEHFCTASVVDSRSGDLIITAAHCVAGTGAGLVFVPMYHDGAAPYGTWQVHAAYVTNAWREHQNPQDDFAFLVVQSQVRAGRKVSLEQVVGGDELATGRPFSASTRVVGYPLGMGGRPITCTNRTYEHQGYPGFNCQGYVDGTSGGPFVVDFDAATGHGDVDGVIGGLHQGGCFPYTSYSSYFGAAVRNLYRRAEAGEQGDVVPLAGSDGC